MEFHPDMQQIAVGVENLRPHQTHSNGIEGL